MTPDHIIPLEAASRVFQHWKQEAVLKVVLQSTGGPCLQPTSALTTSLFFLFMSPHWYEPFQSPALFTISVLLLLASLNASCIYASRAPTPDIYAEPSHRRHPHLWNEGAPLGGDAKTRHRYKQLSILTLLLSQKVKWHIHPMIRLQR